MLIARPGASTSETDYYRSQYRGAPDEDRPQAPAEDGHSVAVQLQDAFAEVARSAMPSVVGVSVYERGAGEGSPQAGWQQGSIEDRLYPGFRRTRAASGFLVSGDGDVL